MSFTRKSMRKTLLCCVAAVCLIAFGFWLYFLRLQPAIASDESSQLSVTATANTSQPPLPKMETLSSVHSASPERPAKSGSILPRRRDPAEVVARVGEVEITHDEVSLLTKDGNEQSALNQLIDRALLLNEFNTRGVGVPETMIDQRVEEVVKNEFSGDLTAFGHNLKEHGQTLADFRQLEAENVVVLAMRSMLLDEVGVKSSGPTEQREALQRWLQEQRQKVPISFPSAEK